jgi:hypothetical protein
LSGQHSAARAAQEEGGMVTTLREAVMSRPTIIDGPAVAGPDAVVCSWLFPHALCHPAGALLYP